MDSFIPNCVWASNGRLNNAYNINDAIEDGAGFVFLMVMVYMIYGLHIYIIEILWFHLEVIEHPISIS